MSEQGLPGKEVKRVQQRLDFQRFSGKRRLNGDLLLLLSRRTASAPGLETAQGQKGKRSGGVVASARRGRPRPLCPLEGLHGSRCQKKVQNILQDSETVTIWPVWTLNASHVFMCRVSCLMSCPGCGFAPSFIV